MPPIPKYRRKRLPSTNVGAAPLPMSVDTGARAIGQGMQALGAGISNLGESLFKIKQADNRNKDLLAESQLSSAIKSAELDYKDLTSKDGDVNNYPGYRQQSIDKINSMKDTIEWGTTSAQKRAGILTSGWTNVFTKETEIGMVFKRSAETIKVTEANLIQSLSSLDDSEEQGIMNERSEAAYREALSFKYGPDQIDLIVAGAISEGAKGRAINLASLGDFEEARKLVNKTNFADPKDREAILNSIRLMESKKNDLTYERDLETNKDFISKLISGNADLPNEVQRSRLPKKSSDPQKITKADWDTWIDGSQTPLPDSTTLDAIEIVTETVNSHSKDKINTEAALKSILEVMYEDRESTNKIYQWSLDQMDNPYPDSVNDDLQAVLESNRNINRGFFTHFRESAGEKAKSARVATKFISWLDIQMKADKQPTTKEMYRQAEILRAQDGTVNDVFDTIADDYTVGQQITKDNIVYTYKGDGVWSY